MNLCEGEVPSREELIEQARLDRDTLSERFLLSYPDFRELPPAAWVEDLIVSICGFRVCDFPLPRGQLGVCDVANRLVLVNSDMPEFVPRVVDLKALRAATLGHELGHIRWHADELRSRFVTCYGRWNQVQDSRLRQREEEAELYAAVFMVPGKLLVGHQVGQEIYQAWRKGDPVRRGRADRAVRELARHFGVTRALMRRSLAERGWISALPGPTRRDRAGRAVGTTRRASPTAPLHRARTDL
jgi:hypothetical protein